MYPTEDKSGNQQRQITKTELNRYRVYQRFYNGAIVQPGAIIECTELQARCINTIQPMTLRLIGKAHEAIKV